MALSSLSYFSNSIPGELVAPGDVDLYEQNSNPKFAIGTRVSTQDGRVWRYAQFGAVTSQGVLVSQDISETGVGVTDNAVIAPASAVSISGETVKPGQIGSRFIQVTLAATAANKFSGAYFHVEDDLGEGFTYRIKGNTATDNPVTGQLLIELHDRLKASLDVTTDFAITGSMWNDVKTAALSTFEKPSGVSMASVVAATPFAWVQTWGPSTVLCDGAVAVGDTVTIGSVTGSVATQAAFTSPVVGYALYTGTSTAQVGVYLTISS